MPDGVKSLIIRLILVPRLGPRDAFLRKMRAYTSILSHRYRIEAASFGSPAILQLNREDIKSDGHVRNSIEENVHMYRLMIVVILIGIFLAQDAPASQVPNSRPEVNVDTMSMPQMSKAQPSRAPDILESKLVGRLYTLTYGGRELCEQVGLEEAARFELVLEGFHDAFPDVMQQFQTIVVF